MLGLLLSMVRKVITSQRVTSLNGHKPLGSFSVDLFDILIGLVFVFVILWSLKLVNKLGKEFCETFYINCICSICLFATTFKKNWWTAYSFTAGLVPGNLSGWMLNCIRNAEDKVGKQKD